MPWRCAVQIFGSATEIDWNAQEACKTCLHCFIAFIASIAELFSPFLLAFFTTGWLGSRLLFFHCRKLSSVSQELYYIGLELMVLEFDAFELEAFHFQRKIHGNNVPLPSNCHANNYTLHDE